jgi:hypothetical protein
MGDFIRPDMPVNFQARSRPCLSDLLEEAGGSLDTFRRALWKDAVRLPIQEGFCSDDRCASPFCSYHRPMTQCNCLATVYSIDLIKILRQSCLRHQYHSSSQFYLKHLLKATIQHESLSLVIKHYPEEIVRLLERLESHAAALEDKIDSSWAEDLIAAEEAHHSPTIGRVR